MVIIKRDKKPLKNTTAVANELNIVLRLHEFNRNALNYLKKQKAIYKLTILI